MISFEIQQASGNQDVIVKMSSVEQLTEFGIRKAWFASGKDLKKSASAAVLAKPRHGRLYVSRNRAGARRRHRASRPGESHANFSGMLRRSLNWKVSGMELDFGYGVVQRAPSYARFVEEGTKNMEARPTLQNSVKANQRNMEQHMSDAVAREFK